VGNDQGEREPGAGERLEPQLRHNRKESEELGRRKRQLLIAMVFLAFPLTLIVPRGPAGLALGILIGLTAAAVLFIEVKRVLVFRRDLRERRSSRPD
jgi:hypothetical protein